MKVHILTQYSWPDGSPVCLISESIANELYKNNIDVCMVSGSGLYRDATRIKPPFKIVNLNSISNDRNKKKSILVEYYSVFKHQTSYIRKNVQENDLLIITSAPFFSIFLRYFIPKKVKTLYWLFDYFPASLKCLYNVPNFIKYFFDLIWRYELSKWDYVIKISSNLGYFGKNVHTFRQWPMIDINPSDIKPNKSAIYTGNLGIAHDEVDLILKCKDLKEKGYEINIFADGPKIKLLPDWMTSKGTFKNENDLIAELLKNELHLITGTPNTDELSFPSKIWNSIASGREVVPCGMIGKMKEEFEISLKADYKEHKQNLLNFILKIIN